MIALMEDNLMWLPSKQKGFCGMKGQDGYFSAPSSYEHQLLWRQDRFGVRGAAAFPEQITDAPELSMLSHLSETRGE